MKGARVNIRAFFQYIIRTQVLTKQEKNI